MLISYGAVVLIKPEVHTVYKIVSTLTVPTFKMTSHVKHDKIVCFCSCMYEFVCVCVCVCVCIFECMCFPCRRSGLTVRDYYGIRGVSVTTLR